MVQAQPPEKQVVRYHQILLSNAANCALILIADHVHQASENSSADVVLKLQVESHPASHLMPSLDVNPESSYRDNRPYQIHRPPFAAQENL